MTVYKDLIHRIGMSRVMLDIQIGEAVKQGLIVLDREGDIRLQAKGKLYAIQHKLITA